MKNTQNQSTLIIAVVLALLVGFTAGVLVTVYKTPSLVSQLPQAQSNEPTDKEIQDHIKHLLDEVEKDPQDVKAWVQLGNAYFDLDSPEKAIDAYLKSLAMSPDNPDVLTDLGIMYRRIKQPKMAIESFDKATQVDPTHLQSRFNKGVVLYHDLNDQEGAVVAWQEVAKLQPDFSPSAGQTIQQLLDKMK